MCQITELACWILDKPRESQHEVETNAKHSLNLSFVSQPHLPITISQIVVDSHSRSIDLDHLHPWLSPTMQTNARPYRILTDFVDSAKMSLRKLFPAVEHSRRKGEANFHITRCKKLLHSRLCLDASYATYFPISCLTLTSSRKRNWFYITTHIWKGHPISVLFESRVVFPT